MEKYTTDPPQWLNGIIEQLNRIEKRLDTIETVLGPIRSSSTHMENHIEFVETIYDNIKMPFHYILDKVTPIAYISSFTEPKQITDTPG